MSERPTIAFRVDEAQKEEWVDYADEKDEYDSLSHLIRVAVAHEMSDQYGPQTGSSGDSGSVEGLGGIETALNKIEGQLDEFGTTLESVEDGVYSNQTTLKDDTVTKAFNRIPEGDSLTAKEVAGKIRTSEKRAAMALEVLVHDTGAITREITDGEIGYTRKTVVPEGEESEPASGPDSSEDIHR